MTKIIDMTFFVTVVKVASFTDAARRLNTVKSVVSRRISDLERDLGAPLLDRSARGVRPTEVGAVYYAKCVRILESIQSANDFVTGFNSLVEGRLSVIACRTFESLIAPILNRFTQKYPDIVLDVEAGGFDELDFDVAIRTGEIENSDLVARPLTAYRHLLCASPAYLQRCGSPGKPEELVHHEGLGDGGAEFHGVWRLSVDGQWRDFRYRERMRSDSPRQLIEAARDGLGIAMVPEPLVRDDVADGRLHSLLAEFPAPAGTLSAVYPKSRRQSQKVQRLLSFLMEALEPASIEG